MASFRSKCAAATWSAPATTSPPPYMLSSEETGDEINWSEGRYLEPGEITAAFGAPTRGLHERKSVHPCQPNPHGAQRRWILMAGALGLLMWLVLTVIYMAGSNEVVTFQDGAKRAVLKQGEASAIFPLTLTGSRDSLVVIVSSSASDWAAIDVTLIDPATESSIYLPVLLYSRNRREHQTYRGVLNGDYLLKIERFDDSTFQGPVTVELRRGASMLSCACCTLPILLLVPMFVLVRHRYVEHRRWAESDHA
ncbi:hypothetical protein OAX78_02680 [Planctomycetota bacterium]|nr:hypothetical protein [Planctomycetota bacterium]